MAHRRETLIKNILRLADQAIFGTLSETYRTCGNQGCRCHGEGPKHGPHLYISYRGEAGKTTGYYVPKTSHAAFREGVLAWKALQDSIRELADINKQQFLEGASEKS